MLYISNSIFIYSYSYRLTDRRHRVPILARIGVYFIRWLLLTGHQSWQTLWCHITATINHKCPFVMNPFCFELWNRQCNTCWNRQCDTCSSGAMMWRTFSRFCSHPPVVLQGITLPSASEGMTIVIFDVAKEQKRTYYPLWCERYLKGIYSTHELNFRTSKISISGSLKIYFPKCYFYRVFICWNTFVFTGDDI